MAPSAAPRWAAAALVALRASALKTSQGEGPCVALGGPSGDETTGNFAMQAAMSATDGAGNSMFLSFIEKTEKVVNSWLVEPASKTDRVLVTIFQPGTRVSLFNYAIRSSLHRLGPKWALQVFYGKEEERAKLDEALGKPANVIWTPLAVKGTRRQQINKYEANYLRLSPDFWNAIPEEYEHILMIEDDSLVIRGNGCIDKFLEYDYIGSPWIGSQVYGGNGGFSLRRRSAMLKLASSEAMEKAREPPPEPIENARLVKHKLWEDHVMVPMMVDMKMNLAHQNISAGFGVETLFYPTPCGIHKPWNHQGDSLKTRCLLATADFD